MNEEDRIKLKGYVGRKFYDDSKTYNQGYKVYAFYPNTDCQHLVMLNEYNNISINGKMPELIEAKEYIIECVIDKTGKYSNSYKVMNILNNRSEKISPEETVKFLTSISISRNIIENIIKECPNMIDLIINDKVDTIDISKIKGLGDSRFSNILQKVDENYKFFDIMTEYSDMGLTMNMIKALYEKYTSIEMVRKAMDSNPYDCLCSIARVGFKTADARIINKNETFKTSPFRMKECIKYLLTKNQEEGNTWITVSDLYKQAIDTTPDCITYFANEIKNNDEIYLDTETKKVAFTKTFACEYEIAFRIKTLLAQKKHYNFDVSKYTKSREGFELSEKQKRILPHLNTDSICVLMGYAGTGKAQPLESKVLTSHGWDLMENMKVGTSVYGEDGKLHSVTGVYPQGIKDVYEVVFNDGTKTECCKEHLWSIQKPTDRKTGRIRIMSLEDIMKEDLYQTNAVGNKRWMFYIPMTEPIEYEYKQVNINPYLLGVLIGDGGMSDKRQGVGVCLYEEDIYTRISNILKEDGFKMKKQGTDNRKVFRIVDEKMQPQRRTILGVYRNRLKTWLDELSLLGLKSEEKHIPKEYLYNSIEVRLELLRGLIDTDGEVYAQTYQYSTSSKQLADDVTMLVQSLGGTSKIEERQTYFNSNGIKKAGLPSYRLHIKMPKNIIAFSSNKHKSKYRVGQTEARRTIREIKYLGKKECQCIMVDNPTHLYLTNDHIVTHNTTSSKAVVDMICDYKKRVLLLAPTGRASKVLANMTGKDASTIHRGLRLFGEEERNSTNPITEEFVICDEASMADIWLFRSLLRAIDPESTTLIFVCDPAQLASVGCGNVISDVIQSEVVPTVFLDEVFRYGEGGLSYIATEIRNGRKYLDNSEGKTITNFGDNKDYSFIKCLKEDTLDMVMHLYSKLISNGMDRNELILLSAYNKGELGTYNLNNLVQSYVNPAIEEDIFTRKIGDITISFRVGDRVIQTKNNYRANLYIEDRSQIVYNKKGKAERATTKIFNGDDGVIKEITDMYMVIDFSGELIEYEQKDLNSLLLGYAISVHKSQGSSFDNAMIISPVSHKYFTKRNLLYVAVTRARKRVFHIGDVGSINYALNQSENIMRNTFLCDLLKSNDLESKKVEYQEEIQTIMFETDTDF